MQGDELTKKIKGERDPMTAFQKKTMVDYSDLAMQLGIFLPVFFTKGLFSVLEMTEQETIKGLIQETRIKRILTAFKTVERIKKPQTANLTFVAIIGRLRGDTGEIATTEAIRIKVNKTHKGRKDQNLFFMLPSEKRGWERYGNKCT